MAVREGNGFPFSAQPAHSGFVSIAGSIPLPVARPPPSSFQLNPSAMRLDTRRNLGDVIRRAIFTSNSRPSR